MSIGGAPAVPSSPTCCGWRATPTGTAAGDRRLAVRQRLARFYVRQKGLQYTSYRTLTALSRAPSLPGGSIGKLVGAPLRQEMASFAMTCSPRLDHRPDDRAEEAACRKPISHPRLAHRRWTDEILRNIIAERILLLPRHPRRQEPPFKDIQPARNA